MKRQTILEIVLFIALVALGATVRISLQHLPNFAPVAALALFAGYLFRSRWAAIAVPVSIMLLSDLLKIGGYAWWQMMIVYSMLAFPVLMRSVLRRHFQFAGGTKSEFARSFGGLLGCSLLCSVLFFLVTNAICLGWYEPTWAGVLQCYSAGLLFFKFTLAGDMIFAMLTFGSYATVMSLIAAVNPEADDLAQPSVNYSATA